MIDHDPVTLFECLKYWLLWRLHAAHDFVRRCMRLNINTRKGSQNLGHAPSYWYVDRFVAGWRLGKLYIIRVRREFRRKSKTVT